MKYGRGTKALCILMFMLSTVDTALWPAEVHKAARQTSEISAKRDA